MVFTSLLFLFYFLPAVLGLYYLSLRLGSRSLAHFVLTAVSYLFYGWSNPIFVVLMFGSTLIDYLCGLVIARQIGGRAWAQPVAALSPGGPRTRAQRIAVAVSVVANLSLLGVFKYFNFGLDSWNALMSAAGFEHVTYENFLRLTLPLGISFYTFQSMSYTIDVYRGEARAVRSLLDFSCYVAMFPQLVAGPIIRFQEVGAQLRRRRHSLEKFA